VGYTHHWYRKQVLDRAAFAAAGTDLRKVVEALKKNGLRFGRWNSDKEIDPEITSNLIRLNGIGAAGVEEFEVPQVFQAPFRIGDDGRIHAHCKTEHMPYDIAVTAALIILKHHLGDEIHIYSDGELIDWLKGKQLCAEVLQYSDDFQLSET
jgi:hypothetical protein